MCYLVDSYMYTLVFPDVLDVGRKRISISYTGLNSCISSFVVYVGHETISVSYRERDFCISIFVFYVGRWDSYTCISIWFVFYGGRESNSRFLQDMRVLYIEFRFLCRTWRYFTFLTRDETLVYRFSFWILNAIVFQFLTGKEIFVYRLFFCISKFSPDYTLCSGVHVCWSEHSDSSFVYGFMILDYGFGTMTATTFSQGVRFLYSWLSLSRSRLSRITAYLEVKIWSLPKLENLTTGKPYCRKEEKLLLRSNFSSFLQYFQYISNSKSPIKHIFVKHGCSNYYFLNSANLIYWGTDISK